MLKLQKVDVIYGCPEFGSIGKMESKGDYIHCNNCDSIGYINDYGFIENTEFDNFVE